MERFTLPKQGVPEAWARLIYVAGNGHVVPGADLQLTLAANDGARYSDAQVDDYHADGVLRWRPPLRMKLKACFSAPQTELHGTAGFGFWNDPFGMTPAGSRKGWWRRLKLPQAVWFFFASPPSQIALARDVPGAGWKAATIDASGVMAKALLPLAPFGMLTCRVPEFYRWLWPVAQAVLKVDEAVVLAPMERWHEYELVWREREVRWLVDGVEVFASTRAPRGPLGFVAWIDNQFMVATPQGQMRSGTVATAAQTVWIDALTIERL